MKWFILFVLVTGAICSVESIPLTSKSPCCQLEWVEWIKLENGGRAIPSSGILFGQASNGIKYYFAVPAVGEDIVKDRIIPATNLLRDNQWQTLSLIAWWFTGNKSETKSNNKVYILSNPSDCEIGWISATGEKLTAYDEDTMEWDFPRQNGIHRYFFAKTLEHIPSGTFLKSIGFIHLAENNGIAIMKYNGTHIPKKTQKLPKRNAHEEDNPPDTKVLYVDCAASLKKQLNAELYDIKLASEDFTRTGKKEPQMLALTEVENDTDEDQTFEIELTANTSHSFKMKHETRFKKVTKQNPSLWISTDPGIFGDITAIGRVRGNRIYFEMPKRDHAKSSSSSFEEAEAVGHHFKQQVLVKSKTKMKVTIRTKQVVGNDKYTSYHRIKSDVLKKAKLDVNSVQAIFKRLGITDKDFEEINGSLVWKTPGEISVSTNIDTHVLMESFAMDEVSKRLFVQKIDL